MSLPDAQGTQYIHPVKTVLVPETGFVVSQVNPIDYGYIQVPVRYQGRLFQPKSELHITLVSENAAETVRKHFEKRPGDIDRVQEVIAQNRLSFRKLDEYYYVEESGEETIVQMVDLPNLGTFFQDLAGITGGGYVLPPTHVTLYMRGTETGIGLPSPAVFDARVKSQVQPGELQYLHGA